MFRPTPAAYASAAATMMLPMLIMVGAEGPRVEVRSDEAARRVDVTVDGKPFTSYIYPETLKKPVLWPIRSAAGSVITRGFPLEPRPNERVDHPHHIGLWFNHGDVNGFDFWNNSAAVPPDRATRMGTIVHRRIGQFQSGSGKGQLTVEMDWIGGDGAPLLREQTTFIFRAGGETWTIDRVTTLTALDKQVVFRDNKEGVLGLRVARALEQRAGKPEIFIDASGKPTAVPVLDNTGVTGMYVSSEGLTGDAVWGTRGRWTLIRAKVDDEPVTVAMLDHPSNPGFPTYWHARGYGLFAANMLGAKEFSKGQEEFNFTLESGKSATFRHRVLLRSGKMQPATVEPEYQEFIKAER
jgi:hypothetical protein